MIYVITCALPRALYSRVWSEYAACDWDWRRCPFIWVFRIEWSNTREGVGRGQGVPPESRRAKSPLVWLPDGTDIRRPVDARRGMMTSWIRRERARRTSGTMATKLTWLSAPITGGQLHHGMRWAVPVRRVSNSGMGRTAHHLSLSEPT